MENYVYFFRLFGFTPMRRLYCLPYCIFKFLEKSKVESIWLETCYKIKDLLPAYWFLASGGSRGMVRGVWPPYQT